MKKLELIKGLSYSTMTFSAKKGVPFSAEDEVAEKLLATGRFKEVEAEAAGTADGAPKSVDEMKKDELIAYAEKLGIDISSCANNDERKAAIKAAETAGDGDGEQDPVPGFLE